MAGDRCTGHCCRAFTMHYSPEQLLSRCFYDNDVGDGRVLASMARPLGYFSRADAPPGHRNPPSGSWWYTCAHFDEASGQCGIYDRRPRMCWMFPYGSACPYEGCTWDKGRGGCVGHPPGPHARLSFGDAVALHDWPGLAEWRRRNAQPSRTQRALAWVFERLPRRAQDLLHRARRRAGGVGYRVWRWRVVRARARWAARQAGRAAP